MKFLKLKIFLVLCLVLVVFLSNCAKDEKAQEYNSNEPSLIEIQKNIYQPFEAIFFKMDKPWSTAPDSILFGGIYMKVFNQDSFLVGVCPELLPGKYSVKINDKFKYEIDVIKNAEIDPIKVFDSLMSIAETIKKNPNISKQVDYWQNIVKNEWTKLSESEKKQLSQFLALNHFSANKSLDFGDLSYLDSLKGRSQIFNVDEAHLKFFVSFILSHSQLSVGVALTGVGVFTAKTGLGLAALGSGCLLIYKSKNDIVALIEGWKNVTIRINEFSTIEKRGILQLSNGISTKVTIKGNCSNITQNDGSRNDVIWLFNKLNAIESSIKNINNYINKFLSYLPGVEQIEWLNTGYLSPTEYKKTLPLYYGNIAIKNVSNPKIKLSLQEDVNGGVKILTESELTDTVDFQFTLEYKSKYNFNPPNNSKTFDAKYIPNSLNGLWVCQNLTDFNEKRVSTYDCGGVPYKYVSELIVNKLDFLLTQDSLIWLDQSISKEYTIGRSAACGSELNSEIEHNNAYRFKVTSRTSNSVNFIGILGAGTLKFNNPINSNSYTLNFTVAQIGGGDPGISFSNVKCIRQ